MSSISATVKPSEVKREEFRKYLEHSGVMEALTNVLITLYCEYERPDNALEFIRKHFAAASEASSSSEVSSEVETLKKELAEAKAQIVELKEKLSKYEPENTA